MYDLLIFSVYYGFRMDTSYSEDLIVSTMKKSGERTVYMWKSNSRCQLEANLLRNLPEEGYREQEKTTASNIT